MVYLDDRGLWPKARHPNAVDKMHSPQTVRFFRSGPGAGMQTREVCLRLRYIKRLGAPLSMLKLLISALVGAALVWAGGVAKPNDGASSHCRQALPLEHACVKDHVPIAEAFDSWMVVLPQAAQVIERLGWQVLKGGKQLSCCNDLARQRLFNFGYDSPQVLEEWLCVEYRRMFLNRCGRVRQRLHRDGQFALGMDLPAPVMQDLCFAGHCQLFHQAPFPFGAPCRCGHGGSFWYWAAGAKIGPKG